MRAACSYSRTASKGSFNRSSSSPNKRCPSASSAIASAFRTCSRAPAKLPLSLYANAASYCLLGWLALVAGGSLDFSVSVCFASDSLVRELAAEPCKPRLLQSVTPATVKFGSSLNSIAPGETLPGGEDAEDSNFNDPAARRTKSTCFLSPGDNTRASATASSQPDFPARTVYVPP